jgi:ribosomal-protein-alanine N-acetyltransferase
VIRPATPGDLATLASLHAQSFAEAWDAAAFEKLLQSPGTFGLLFDTDGTASGFVLVRAAAGEAEILSVGVSPSARRRGIARSLIAAAAAEAAQRAVKKIFLEVGAENGGARGLYRVLGFRQVGTRRGYYRHPDGTVQDALVLSAEIPLARSFLGNPPEVD